MGAGESGEEAAKLLAFRAGVVADWADRMPLRNVYIFGDHASREAAPASKLKIAVEHDCDVSDDILRSWQQKNSTGFAELKKALGIETELHRSGLRRVATHQRRGSRAPHDGA